jgi:hypothetical protein
MKLNVKLYDKKYSFLSVKDENRGGVLVTINPTHTGVWINLKKESDRFDCCGFPIDFENYNKKVMYHKISESIVEMCRKLKI